MTLLSSLTNRIFLASALLVIIAMSVAIYRVDVTVTAQAENDLRAGLNEAASLVDQLSRTEFEDFLVKGELIADLPVLKGAAATGDPPTVLPIARDYQSKIGADVFIVLDRQDHVLAHAGRIPLDEGAMTGILAACRASRDGTSLWPFSDGLLHVAVIPMDAGLGALIVGVSLDQQAAAAIKAVTNSEIAFVTGSRVVASTFDAGDGNAVVEFAGRSDVFTVPIGDEVYIGRVQRLVPAADGSAPVALVLQSQTEHLMFLSRLRWQIALTGFAAVIGATLIGYLVARSVTQPLRALTGAMGEMAATGDLTRPLPPLGRWTDEDVRLVATTFHRLTSALDRIQREASLRERLSSLGRLSTVVAHEIRNPLMIIKSALRSLRSHASPDVAGVAGSIDEEVHRLNRVVTGVLDFAKPIQYDLAPADLGAICRAAAQAAESAAADVPIAVEAAAGDSPLVTDIERLRSVIVNVLNNAQQAVRRSGRAGVNGALITIRASRESGSGWRIAVTDRGAGIQPDDLPKIFDPFFTTRNGGSGLGLAIGRNIIEGLGGRMSAESRVGDGTTVFIDLPDRHLSSEARA